MQSFPSCSLKHWKHQKKTKKNMSPMSCMCSRTCPNKRSFWFWKSVSKNKNKLKLQAAMNGPSIHAAKWSTSPRRPYLTEMKAFENFNHQGLRMILSKCDVCGVKSVWGGVKVRGIEMFQNGVQNQNGRLSIDASLGMFGYVRASKTAIIVEKYKNNPSRFNRSSYWSVLGP